METEGFVQEISPFFFNVEAKRWERCEGHTFDEEKIPTSIRLATHNVLKVCNWWMEWIVRSPERFAKEMQILEELNADIIGLNEVTEMFLRLLQEQEWVRNKYFLSDVMSSKSTHSKNKSVFSNTSKEPMGNLIMSKYPFHRVYSYRYSTEANCPRNTTIATYFETRLIVCSAHITAYETLHERRALQMKEFTQFMDSYFSNCKDVFIMGDLNLHLVKENQVITDIGYIDLWKGTEEDNEGFTWDTTKNGLIHLLQMVDNRRMRLDRIIAKSGCSWEPTSPVSLFATDPVYAGSYLQCSDHFGLYTDLVYPNDL